MKKLLLTLCLLASALLPLASQNLVTKVRGVVTDADSGEPVPFAAVFFKGTQTGLTADIDGRYSLETRDRDATVLVCQLLGYDTVEKEVRYGVFTEVNFKMHLTDNRLSGAIVKADDRKIRRLLANIEGGLVFARDGSAVWQCANCGHIVVGPKAPEICPVCDHPQSYFQVEATNY